MDCPYGWKVSAASFYLSFIYVRRPCLKHAGTPGRRRECITGRDAGRDAGTVETLY